MPSLSLPPLSFLRGQLPTFTGRFALAFLPHCTASLLYLAFYALAQFIINMQSSTVQRERDLSAQVRVSYLNAPPSWERLKDFLKVKFN
ncbi:hypothetical protein P389DRAFT_175123 [Cystobasidium minutum MCA 4210]|uniref:uncharacterized protein n=1 Tax=Cystobasidium minutum MCA 4210 TaxID=1397322 RepID=UPI0034CDDAA1|eukprot:jgi/Rhomi1/175123/fgenesh1_kg.9_\